MPSTPERQRAKYHADLKGSRNRVRDKARRENADPIKRARKIATHRAWRKRNPDRVRGANLKKKYGITLADYEAMLEAQGRRCKSCGSLDPLDHRGVFHVDHDHLTGDVRGLLCNACNLLIGHAREDADRLLAAAMYLKRTRGL
jgi:hypothetical protein